jgi:hypothetical protein
MAGARWHFFLVIVLCLGSPVVWAQSVTVNTSLNLNSLTITPASGSGATVNFTTPVVGTTDSAAQDTAGGTASGTTSATDSPFANASGAASLSPLGGSAIANVTLPYLFAGYASSSADSYLSGAFEITGTSNPVDVTFTAALSNNQYLLTDANGQSAYSESIFTLLLPDVSSVSSGPVLGYDNLLTLTGPNQSKSTGGPQPLSTTITLQPNTPYSFTTTLDAEANGYGVLAVPDGSNPVALMLIAVGLSAAFGGLITRKPRSAERG